MFGIDKIKKKLKKNNIENEDEKQKDYINLNTDSVVISDSVYKSVGKVNKQFEKPNTYTGNRKLYDDGLAKKKIKIDALSQGKKYRDPYTGKELVLTKKEAKLKFGKNWANHLAEGDHIVPIEKVHNQYKSDAWVTNDDIKNTVNSKENMQAVSRKFNNAKRNKMQDKFATDEEYLKKTNVKLTEKGKEKALQVDKDAKQFIKKELRTKKIKNVVKTSHEAGKNASINSGITTATISSILNVTAVIKGEKDTEEALYSVAKDTGKAAASGYILGGGLTSLSHTLSNSSSTFIKKLVSSNIPGNIITAVVVTGDTIKKYAEGEISTEECVIELGEKGLNLATTGSAMAIGQAVIPIPIVGAAVGALVGSVAMSKLYNDVVYSLKNKQLEHEERMRLIEESRYIRDQLINFRKELELYFSDYFNDCTECFSFSLTTIKSALLNGDANGVIFGANEITKKLGGKVKFNNMNEFYDFLLSNEEDEL